MNLGFKIPPNKSIFSPVQEITFLGYVINRVQMKVRSTQEKMDKMKEALKQQQEKCGCKIIEIAGLIGLMVDCTKGVEELGAGKD